MYYDLLAKIKNAERAKKESLLTPFSEFDFAVAKILAQGGYISDAHKKTAGRKEQIEIKLHKSKNGFAVNGYKIVSKPSRRIYIKYQALKPVKGGYGIAVVSTSKGVVDSKAAKKAKVGGEYLFEVW